jgi:hypothetical protein
VLESSLNTGVELEAFEKVRNAGNSISLGFWTMKGRK